MHESAMRFLRHAHEAIVDQLSTQTTNIPTLEVGSININGSAREVFGHYQPYTGVDIVSGPNVDVVVDIQDYSAAKRAGIGKYNLIICTEVLEHTPPIPLLNAMLNYADPEGCIIVITCAGPNRAPHSADGGSLKQNEYYANVSPKDIQSWIDNLHFYDWIMHWRIIATNADQTDVYACIRIEQ